MTQRDWDESTSTRTHISKHGEQFTVSLCRHCISRRSSPQSKDRAGYILNSKNTGSAKAATNRGPRLDLCAIQRSNLLCFGIVGGIAWDHFPA
jgi:hypothetical protein